jgi:hypothetical protein
MGVEAARTRIVRWVPWLVLILPSVAMLGAWGVVGTNLGLFFFGIILASLLTPPLCLCEEPVARRVFVAMAISLGIGVVEAVAALMLPIALRDGIACYIVLMVWTLALVGMASAAAAIFRSPALRVPAAGVTTVLGLAWLSWPVWLAQALPGHPWIVRWLVPVHPLLAINGAMRELGIWTQRPIAYQWLVTLGQDVPYELPASVLPAILLHGCVALLLLGAAWLGSRWTFRSTNHTDAAATANITP